MKALKNLNEISPVLLSGAAAIIISAIIFLALIPEIKAVSRLNAAISVESKTLNYVAGYSKKIEFLKKYTKSNLSRASASSAYAANRPEKTAANKNKSVMKFLNSMLAFYKIKKPSVAELTESFSNKAKNSLNSKKITMKLKGIDLNQAIGIIYSASSSGYGVSIVSSRIKKNFRNKKLLNLSLVMNAAA